MTFAVDNFCVFVVFQWLPYRNVVLFTCSVSLCIGICMSCVYSFVKITAIVYAKLCSEFKCGGQG